MNEPPQAVIAAIEEALGSVKTIERVGGGCIANACRANTDDGPAFVKWGTGDVAASFSHEAAGLCALADAGTDLVIPRVIVCSEADGIGVLVLEWLDVGGPSQRFWRALGEGLAQLHESTADSFGFESDNVIGRIAQVNTWRDSWPEFFASFRLQPQVDLARAGGVWSARWDARIQRVASAIDDIIGVVPGPSLIHGDLWSGNILPLRDGTAAIIDPAVYFGHDEAELAYTELFGGFDAEFYASYRALRPLEAGYPRRRDLYNLYHLINHLNHFGRGYAGQVESTLARLSG